MGRGENGLTRGVVGIPKSKVAFTLAEVLITLGIIGVVAAMTLPSLINNIKHKQLEAGFKTAYSIFSQGFMNMKREDGEGLVNNYVYYDKNLKTYPKATEFRDNFYKYSGLKVVGKCSYNGKKARNYNDTNDAYTYNSFSDLNKYELSNGMCSYVIVNAYMIMLMVDTNGEKRPNQLGHDIFYFKIDNNDTLRPFKMSRLYTEEELKELGGYVDIAGDPCTLKSKQAGNGVGCAYYALINKNPDNPSKGYWESLP